MAVPWSFLILATAFAVPSQQSASISNRLHEQLADLRDDARAARDQARAAVEAALRAREGVPQEILAALDTARADTPPARHILAALTRLVSDACVLDSADLSKNQDHWILVLRGRVSAEKQSASIRLFEAETRRVGEFPMWTVEEVKFDPVSDGSIAFSYTLRLNL